MRKEIEIRFPLPVAGGGPEPVSSAVFRSLCDEFDDYYDSRQPARSMGRVLVAACVGFNGSDKRPEARTRHAVFAKMAIPVRIYGFDALLKASDPNGHTMIPDVQCVQCLHVYESPLIGELPEPPPEDATQEELVASRWMIEAELDLALEEPFEVPRSGQTVTVDKLRIRHGTGEDQEAIYDTLVSRGPHAARRAMRVRRIVDACGVRPVNSDLVKRIGRGDRKRWEKWDRDNAIVDPAVVVSACPRCGAKNRSLKDYSLFF